MVRRIGSLLCALALIGVAFAANGPSAAAPRKAQRFGPGFLQQLGARPHFSSYNRLSADTKTALQNGGFIQVHPRTIPHFYGGFTTKGVNYPYTMVGARPQDGGRTGINTAFAAVDFFFEEWLDDNNNNITISVKPVLSNTLRSPNFVASDYTSGNGQFGDAVQRAEFHSIMTPGWHTTLRTPRRLKDLTIVVPFGVSQVGQLPDGSFAALLDGDFFNSQLATLLQLEDQQPEEFFMVLTNNVFLYDGDPSNCCVLGFHSAYDVRLNGRVAIQTFAWASWTGEDLFGNFADVTPLSHEISEWMNDPYVNNLVPPWQFPGLPGTCQGNLETGDPIEVVDGATFPVTLHGFTYHPQNEALLQWFSRRSPSGAINGAYSYPDTGLLTSPAEDCAAR
jgi:hypothetical protein